MPVGADWARTPSTILSPIMEITATRLIEPGAADTPAQLHSRTASAQPTRDIVISELPRTIAAASSSRSCPAGDVRRLGLRSHAGRDGVLVPCAEKGRLVLEEGRFVVGDRPHREAAGQHAPHLVD